MKKTIITTLIVLISVVAFAQKKTYLGEKINEKGAISTRELVSKLATVDSMDVKFEGTLQSVCQKKGCWVNVDLGDNQTMMVRFKDYGFFMPKDCAGQKAVFQGRVFKETLSVAQRRHYLEDAGKSKEEIEKITEPETKFSFEADGVILYSAK